MQCYSVNLVSPLTWDLLECFLLPHFRDISPITKVDVYGLLQMIISLS